MKKSQLRQIIREEIKAALEAEAPAKEKETIEAPPTTTPGKTPKRRGFDKPGPGVKPKPKATMAENEKEIVNKITQRYFKLK